MHFSIQYFEMSNRNQIPIISRDILRNEEYQKKHKPISGLHSQFEELKKKIKDVQNKNEKIIQKIHNAFNFKKKAPYVEQPYNLNQPQARESQHSLTYYEKKRLSNQFVSTQQNKSPIRVFRTQGTFANNQCLNSYSQEIRKSSDLKFINQQSTKSAQNSMKQLQSNLINQLEGALELEKARNNQLLKQKKKKQEEIGRLIIVDEKFRNFAETSTIIFESGLSNLMQAVIRNQMINIERVVKKNQLRMIKLAVQVRQAHEDHRSNKVIKEHKRRRSASKSVHKVDNKTSRSELSKSQVKIAAQQSTKKSKQYQQVVNKYQQIIRGKNQEIQNLDKRLKLKDQECLESKNKLENFIKKTKNQKNQISNFDTSKNIQLQEQYKLKFKDQQLIINQERSKIKVLTKKIAEIEKALYQKDLLYSQLKQTNQSNEQKVMKFKNMQKNYEISQNKELESKSKLGLQMEQRIAELQKKVMEKDCQIYGIQNKIKKLEQMVDLKEKKIEQLQKLLRSNEQLMDKSMCMDASIVMSHTGFKAGDIKRVSQENQKLQEQIQLQKQQFFFVLKQKEANDKKIGELEEKIIFLQKKIGKLQQQIQQKDNNLLVNQQDEEQSKLEYQIIELSEKCDNLSKTIQNLKTQNLEMNSKYIKLQSQFEFTKEIVREKQNNLEKYRRENDDLRNRIMILEKQISQKQQELQMEKKAYEEKIYELEKQWQQFEQNIKEESLDFNERRSEISMVNYKSNFNQISTQNQYLTEKLKEAQATIETQNIMEEKIINEYRMNVEKVKTEVKQKNAIIQKLNNQLEKNKKRILQLEVKVKQKQKSDNGLERLQERIDQLQNQLKQSKDINQKLTQMTSELFQKIKQQQQQKSDLMRQIDLKNFRINQLQQLNQMQGSRFSSNSNFRQSRQSQLLKGNNQNELSHSHILHDGKTELQQSFEHSFLDNSRLNVSQIFRQMPYDKLKLKKREHKLFEKTSQYINSLKQSLEEKNKKIRILQKKIESLKSSELVRKNYDLSGKDLFEDNDNTEGQFKDYESVQLDNRKGGYHHRRFKMLENDTKLVVEENNMLRQQIEILQEDAERAEQQENSLVKIKDLYKDQIKKLIKKNQDQTKVYQEQLQRQRLRNEQSQSVHNFIALKQLFIKVGLIIGTNSEGKKKEEKKKQLEQYFKVILNILKVQQSDKDQIIKNIRSQ